MRSEHSTGREYGQRYSWTPFPAAAKSPRSPVSVFMAADHPEMVGLSEAFLQRGGRARFVMWTGTRAGKPIPFYAIYSRIGDCVSGSPEETVAAMREVISNWVDPYQEMIDLAHSLGPLARRA